MNNVEELVKSKVKKIRRNIVKKPHKAKLTGKDYNEIKKEVSSGRSNYELKKSVSGFKTGNWVIKGEPMQVYYGCNTCPFTEKCDKFPHANGGCAERYQYIHESLKRWEGDSKPLMMEIALQNEEVAAKQYAKDMKRNGEPSLLYVALRKLSNDLHVHTQKHLHGSKIIHEKKVSFKDIRDELFKKPIDVEVVDGKDNK